MDRELSENPEIQRLIHLSQASRTCLDHEAAALIQRFDVPARIHNSLQKNPSKWLFGSLASGLAASLFFRRKPTAPTQPQIKPAATTKPPSLPKTLLALSLTAARPMIQTWLTDQAKHWLAHTLANRFPNPPAPSTSPRRASQSNPTH